MNTLHNLHEVNKSSDPSDLFGYCQESVESLVLEVGVSFSDFNSKSIIQCFLADNDNVFEDKKLRRKLSQKINSWLATKQLRG